MTHRVSEDDAPALSEYLQSLSTSEVSMSRHFEALCRNGYSSLTALRAANESDLECAGIPKGHALYIVRALKKRNFDSDGSSTSDLYKPQVFGVDFFNAEKEIALKFAPAAIYMMARALDQSPLGDEEHTERVKQRLFGMKDAFWTTNLYIWAKNWNMCFDRWNYVYDERFAPNDKQKYDDFRDLLLFLSELAGHSEWKEKRVYKVVDSVVEDHVALPSDYVEECIGDLKRNDLTGTSVWTPTEEEFKKLIKNAAIATLHSGLTFLDKGKTESYDYWSITASNGRWVGDDEDGQPTMYYEIRIDLFNKPPTIREIKCVKKPECPHEFTPLYLNFDHDDDKWNDL